MIKYNGLRRRPTYDELIDYLHNRQETIIYPRRIRFSPYALLEDMDHDAIRRMKYEHLNNKELLDKATQTDLQRKHKSIQTDPYMFDKSFQIDDGVDYDQYLNGNFNILPETADSYPKRQKKTQTKRFEPMIKQLQSRINQPYNFDNDHPLPEQPSLWNIFLIGVKYHKMMQRKNLIMYRFPLHLNNLHQYNYLQHLHHLIMIQ